MSLSRWEAVTREALAAARETGAMASLASHEEALSIAHQLLADPPPARAEACVAALVVSCHNLADLHAEQGDADAAVRYRCEAHEALIALIADPACAAPLRQAALRQSRATHLALIAHVASHGPHPLVTAVLRRACLALNVDGPTRH
ncbi:DUF2753 family protein [Paraburkholderia sp. J94]|uniref:DUF2753 family protein n=1 Tax=Paraburkholderia sp. J94 TaxID=2805441 RepID=UPI002AB1CC9C|nr:DUF2753 family protein [Paraburkholderia sp. J94]